MSGDISLQNGDDSGHHGIDLAHSKGQGVDFRFPRKDGVQSEGMAVCKDNCFTTGSTLDLDAVKNKLDVEGLQLQLREFATQPTVRRIVITDLLYPIISRTPEEELACPCKSTAQLCFVDGQVCDQSSFSCPFPWYCSVTPLDESLPFEPTIKKFIPDVGDPSLGSDHQDHYHVTMCDSYTPDATKEFRASGCQVP